MANYNAMQPMIRRRRRMDPAKTGRAARGRASALYMHGAGIGDTSVSPLTPSGTQALIILQQPASDRRHNASAHYVMTYQEN